MMAAMAVERRYALVRVATGDYLFLANTGETLYRVSRYDDGADYGLDVDYAVRSFWRLRRTTPPAIGEVDVDELDALPWVDVADWLPTRQAGIDYALERP